MKPGDVVQLKCGGPKMVVSAKTIADTWNCCWFDGAILNESSFPEEALEPVTDFFDWQATASTAMRAWQLLARCVRGEGNYKSDAIDFIRDNPPPKEGA